MSKMAGALAVVGGVMLVFGGFAGTTQSVLENARGAVDNWFPDYEQKGTILTVLTIMIYLAMLGGFAVILGGLLMWKGFDIAGKILVWLGTGVGIMSLIVSAIIAYATGKWDAFVTSNMTLVGIGLVLSLVARRLA
jgi:hypothetical protein